MVYKSVNLNFRQKDEHSKLFYGQDYQRRTVHWVTHSNTDANECNSDANECNSTKKLKLLTSTQISCTS